LTCRPRTPRAPGRPAAYLAAKLPESDFDPLGIDGKYGPHTQAAVEAFQKAHGLVIDGKTGAQTASALSLAVAAA